MKASLLLAVLAGLAAAAWIILQPFDPVAAPIAAEKPGRPTAAARLGDAAPPRRLAADARPAAIQARLVRDIEQGLKTGNAAEREFALLKLLPTLIARDPARAARLAEDTPPAHGRADVLRLVAQEWAAVDADAAVAWAAGLRLPAERTSALTDACVQIAQFRPAEAMAVSERFNLGGSYDTLGNLVQLWAGTDFEAASEWVERQRPGEPRDRAFGRLALVESWKEPWAAARLVVQKMGPGAEQAEAAIAVLHQWALRDPAAAAEWVASFPQGTLRVRAEKELAGLSALHPSK